MAKSNQEKEIQKIMYTVHHSVIHITIELLFYKAQQKYSRDQGTTQVHVELF